MAPSRREAVTGEDVGVEIACGLYPEERVAGGAVGQPAVGGLEQEEVLGQALDEPPGAMRPRSSTVPLESSEQRAGGLDARLDPVHEFRQAR